MYVRSSPFGSHFPQQTTHRTTGTAYTCTLVRVLRGHHIYTWRGTLRMKNRMPGLGGMIRTLSVGNVVLWKTHKVCVCVRSTLLADWVSTGYSCQSCSWSAEQWKWNFSCPHSFLRVWSRELVSAVPSFVTPSLNLVLSYGTPHLSAFRYGFH